MDDIILFEQPDGIYRVSANGGTPERIIDAAEGERFSSPQLLPDGRSILFTVGKGGAGLWDTGQIVVQSVESREDRTVVWTGSDARYVSTGHLIYALDEDLFAIQFDLDTLETSGSAVSLEQGMLRAATSDSANYGVSGEGTLVYVFGAGGGGQQRTLVWVDREGNEEAIGLEPGSYYWPRLSPDGTRLTVSIQAGVEGEDVWVSDLTRDPPTLTNVTVDPSLDNVPIWTLDGEQIVFASSREGGQWGFFSKRADGTGAVDLLIQGETSGFFMPYSWSPDGATLAFGYVATGADIGVLSMEDDRDWRPLFEAEANEFTPAISPTGEWIAYVSNQSGEYQVYVERFPDLGGRVQISTDGAETPVWSGDGNELFFRRRRDGATMVVPVETGPTLNPGSAQVLIEQNYSRRTGYHVNYDYDSDGQRFLMIKAGAASDDTRSRPQIITVLNWFEELKERVPVP